MTVKLFFNNETSAIYLNYFIKDGAIEWGALGDETITATLQNHSSLYPIVRGELGSRVQAFYKGRVIWSGRAEAITTNDDSIELLARGDAYRLEDIEDYNAFWSQVGTQGFQVTGPQQVSIPASYDQPIYASSMPSGLLPDAFTMDTNNRAYISYKKNASIQNRFGAQIYYEIPKASERLANYISAQVTCRLPTGWIGAVQVRDNLGSISGLVNIALFNGNAAIQQFTIFREGGAGILSGWSQLYTLVRNDTGGTYTNTQDDGYWFIEVKNIRIMSDYSGNITTTLNGSTVAGSGILFTPVSMEGIIPGSHVVFTTGNNEVVQVKETTVTQFRADADLSHVNGSSIRVPRLLASTVVSGICESVGIVNPIIAKTADDIPNTQFNKVSARAAIDSLTIKGVYAYRSSANSFLFYAVDEESQTYYLRQTRVTFSKDIKNVITDLRADYESFAGFKRTTPYVPIQKFLNISRKRRTESNSNSLQAANIAIDRVDELRQANELRAIPEGGILYNAEDSRVSFARVGSRVVIKNIIPVMYGIRDTNYFLKKVSYDFTTNEFSFVIEDQDDTLETLLAGN